jgi:hypothetical protein
MSWRGTIAAAVVAALAVGASAASAAPDKGKDRPPTTLTSDFQAIWMTEWTACTMRPMGRLAKALHVPIRAGMTPQQAANRLGHLEVGLLYDTPDEKAAGADGCRNGVLWRFYHPAA